jgi:hypothetical protein
MVPIGSSRKARPGELDPLHAEKVTVSAQDRELAELYWHLQRKVHTDPKVRSYLTHLTRILRERHIKPGALNQVGLELAVQDRI